MQAVARAAAEGRAERGQHACHDNEARNAAAAKAIRSAGAAEKRQADGQRREVDDRRRVEQRQAEQLDVRSALRARGRRDSSCLAVVRVARATSRPRTPMAIRTTPPTIRSGAISGPITAVTPIPAITAIVA